MRVELLRHGETTQPGCYIGRSDPPLTAQSRMQMHAATQDGDWTRIVSSPRQRCLAFAQTLAAARGLPLSIDARLVELDFGDWDGVPVAELHERMPDALAAFWRDPLAHPPPNAETLPALRSRVLAALRDLPNDDGATLLVTHGGPLRIALAERDSISLAQLMTIAVPHAARFAFTLHRDGDALWLRAPLTSAA